MKTTWIIIRSGQVSRCVSNALSNLLDNSFGLRRSVYIVDGLQIAPTSQDRKFAKLRTIARRVINPQRKEVTRLPGTIHRISKKDVEGCYVFLAQAATAAEALRGLSDAQLADCGGLLAHVLNLRAFFKVIKHSAEPAPHAKLLAELCTQLMYTFNEVQLTKPVWAGCKVMACGLDAHLLGAGCATGQFEGYDKYFQDMRAGKLTESELADVERLWHGMHNIFTHGGRGVTDACVVVDQAPTPRALWAQLQSCGSGRVASRAANAVHDAVEEAKGQLLARWRGSNPTQAPLNEVLRTPDTCPASHPASPAEELWAGFEPAVLASFRRGVIYQFFRKDDADVEGFTNALMALGRAAGIGHTLEAAQQQLEAQRAAELAAAANEARAAEVRRSFAEPAVDAAMLARIAADYRRAQAQRQKQAQRQAQADQEQANPNLS